MKITDLCQVRAGMSFPQKIRNSDNGDFWVMESRCALFDGSIDFGELTHASLQQFQMPNKALIDQEILIRGKGSTHQAFLFEQPSEQSLIFPTSYFLILTLKDTSITSTRFLTWLINQPKYQQKLKSLASGTTVQHLTKKKFLNFEIDLPTLNKQNQLLELADLMNLEKTLITDISKLRQDYYQLPIASYLEPKNG